MLPSASAEGDRTDDIQFVKPDSQESALTIKEYLFRKSELAVEDSVHTDTIEGSSEVRITLLF